MKKNKPRQRPGVRISRPAVFWILGAIVVGSLAAGGLAGLSRTATFSVAEVVVRQDNAIRRNPPEFSYFLGRNLFDLDTDAQARRLESAYPVYRQVRLSKFYPAQLFIDFVGRRPVACVRLDGQLYIDEDRVLFVLPGAEPLPGVPLITGAERLLSGKQPGTVCKQDQIVLALEMIERARTVRRLRRYPLERVDVADPAEASLFFSVPAAGQGPLRRQLQIKIGREAVAERVEFLATLLAHVDRSLYTIEYIDLRFAEPIIKFFGRDTGA